MRHLHQTNQQHSTHITPYTLTTFTHTNLRHIPQAYANTHHPTLHQPRLTTSTNTLSQQPTPPTSTSTSPHPTKTTSYQPTPHPKQHQPRLQFTAPPTPINPNPHSTPPYPHINPHRPTREKAPLLVAATIMFVNPSVPFEKLSHSQRPGALIYLLLTNFKKAFFKFCNIFIINLKNKKYLII